MCGPNAVSIRLIKKCLSPTNSPRQEFKPLHNICEFLTAIHIYADEARQGKTRYVPATHFCSHVRKDLRQCLIYDSHEKNARLIGVEYMVPKSVYETFPPEEKKLWHSHDFEVKSGMLILPKPASKDEDEWEKAELEAMREIVGLYGKTWHFWEIDAGHEFPIGYPHLMGSATHPSQVDLDEAMAERNKTFNVDHNKKAEARKVIDVPVIDSHANSWWRAAEAEDK
ncbi:uncharacterized protein K452DRAFT_331213 [Aplosporella prunicola CBS 121167]|uniref:DUF1264-domain-containing protein n=1 Tax=Aplosporella prunicola CBS 121167 TaxID=1176127 RepID=A0A6A6BW58_9PEZI|nr:uncharacterized protein K452DRAFT_331213 [Aplosporella prunicola CBS 121167]KAF2147593.1 hypothetical protein K452DRAFT_331213 [Aplosporella prunicola CBS 121167]